jgi:hypothetical protein
MNKSDNKMLFKAIEDGDWPAIEALLDRNPGDIDTYGIASNCSSARGLCLYSKTFLGSRCSWSGHRFRLENLAHTEPSSRQKANHAMQRMRASRLCQSELEGPWRLARTLMVVVGPNLNKHGELVAHCNSGRSHPVFHVLLDTRREHRHRVCDSGARK